MEKFIYALILAARKLRPYFQAHRIEAIKGHALADFILEFDSEVGDKAIVLAEPSSQGDSPVDKREKLPHPWWILHVDGDVNNSGAGAEIFLVTLEGYHLMSAIHFQFYVTNNDAEYEALINGLKIALEVGVVNLIAQSDSELEGVLKEENSKADALAKMGSQMDSIQLGQIPLGVQEIPSVPEVEVFQTQENQLEGWMTPIHNYIRTGAFPEDRRGKLHSQRGARKDLWQSLGGWFVGRQGCYWPTMKEDAFKFVRASDRCQRFTNFSNAPASSITSLASPWPFAMWGIDLIRELPKAKGGVKYAVVAVDYFTKWAEAMPMATITEKKISKELRKLCEDLNIKKDFAAVYHPKSNGQTEAINKIIKHTLKAKLEEKKGDWAEEMPMVLRSYNTTPRTTTGETPFLLTYGYEAMVPVEVGAGSLRRDLFVEEVAEVNQRLYLDLLDEARTNSQLNLVAY
ncbi:uncharacterized protein LOC141718598 [Apium graveolens]|uniref:uncharacterized protein LOC141718598 n=1 Tax=Apium graveolens TaxID=4045 RepID=UPI003D7A574C